MSKSSWKLKIEEIAKRDRMENENTNDWKDLDVKDIPGDFFVNDGYELEYWECDKNELKQLNDPEQFSPPNNYDINGDWVISDSSIESKCQFPEYNLIHNFTTKYRYRLKPLEPIRITEDMKKYKAIHKVSNFNVSTSVSEILSSIAIDIGEIVTVVCLNGDATKVFIKFEERDEVRSIGLEAFNLIFEEII